MFRHHNLYQISTVANSWGIYLDLIFLSYSEIIIESSIDDLFENSVHHSAVTFQLQILDDYSQLDHNEYYWLSYIERLANVDWETLFSNSNSNLVDSWVG